MTTQHPTKKPRLLGVITPEELFIRREIRPTKFENLIGFYQEDPRYAMLRILKERGVYKRSAYDKDFRVKIVQDPTSDNYFIYQYQSHDQ